MRLGILQGFLLAVMLLPFAQANWMDPAWQYRTPLTVTNNGSALTDHQVAVNTTNLVYNNSGLVGSWHFSEGNGTRAADSSGLGNDGTLTNGPTWAAGKFGNGLQFDGSNDYVNAGSSASLAFSSAVTLEAWIKPQTFSVYGPVFGKSGDYSTKRAQFIWLSNPSAPQLYSTLNNNVCIQNSPTGSVPLNAWSHVAFTFDGATAKLYINGTQVSSVACAMALADNSATPLTLGFDSNNIYYFAGTIDEARAYNRTLGAQEIAQHYNASRLRLDYGDLRFANSTDLGLPYWQESDSKVWVKVPYIPNGTSAVYAYYGNPNATGAGNKTAVFRAATGGTISYDGDYVVHTFSSSGTFTPYFTGIIQNVVVIGGGGSGSGSYVSGCGCVGPAGGSGGIRVSSIYLESISPVAVTVGPGGIGIGVACSVNPPGRTGGNSSFGTYSVATGGPGGGTGDPLGSPGGFAGGSAIGCLSHGEVGPGGGGTAGAGGPNYGGAGGGGNGYGGAGGYQSAGGFAGGGGSSGWSGVAGQNGANGIVVVNYTRRLFATPEPSLSLQQEEFVSPVALLGILPASRTTYPNYNETFTLYVYNNQSVADNFTLSCSGTCYYSENPVVTAARENRSVGLTVTSAAAAGTASYLITATSQANPGKSSSVAVSITADASNWRSQWVDAYGNAYGYRTPIAILNGGAALADYQVAVNLTNLIYNNTGLVGSWHFSEGAGTRAADSSGSGKDGTLNGFEFNANSNWAPGKFGNGLRFDGSNDYVYVPADMSNDNTYSFEFWLYDTSATNAGFRRWVTTTTGGVTANTAMIREADGGYLQIYAGTTAATSAAGGGWWKNSWHQFVYVSNGTSTRVYLDGNSTPALTSSASVDPETNVYAGGYYASGPSEFYKGIIDELRVYNYALSAQEIAQHYNASKLRPDYADLRFKNASDALLPYWQESDSLVWVKVPYVPSGASTVYAYYGSPNAVSAGSGAATFPVFDDFDGLGNWVQQSGAWAASNGIVTYPAGAGYLRYASALGLSSGYHMDARVMTTLTAKSVDGFFMVKSNNPLDTNVGYRAAVRTDTGAVSPAVRVDAAMTYGNYDNAENVWNVLELTVPPAGAPTVRQYSGDRSLLGTAAAAATTASPNNFFGLVQTETDAVKSDWILARKYASPEPTLSLRQEETPSPVALLGISPAGKTTYPNYPETFALNITNNQNITDGFLLSCTGNCAYSENPVSLTANQTKTVSVTLASANVSGTANYVITATSQANASNSASILVSLTVDATKWRDQWTDAYGSGFRYRVPIAITNNGTALADYQVNVTIDTASPISAGKMRSDCGDIRITNGTNELPYWIESGCNTSSTKIWARAPYVPAGNSTVYAYYGNAAAAGGSNGDATFEFFDGFPGTSLNASKWTEVDDAGALTPSVSGNVLTLSYNGNDRGYVYRNIAQGNGNIAVEMEAYDDYVSGSNVNWGKTIVAPAHGNDLHTGAAIVFEALQMDGTHKLFVKDVNYNYNAAVEWPEATFRRIKFTRFNGAVKAYVEDVEKASATGEGDAADYIALGGQIVDHTAYSYNRVTKYKNVRVRKYSSPEPSAFAGAEQSKGYRTLVRRCGLKQANANATAYYAGNSSYAGSCLTDANGICTLEIGAGTYNLLFSYSDNSAAWKNGTVFN